MFLLNNASNDINGDCILKIEIYDNDNNGSKDDKDFDNSYAFNLVPMQMTIISMLMSVCLYVCYQWQLRFSSHFPEPTLPAASKTHNITWFVYVYMI